MIKNRITRKQADTLNKLGYGTPIIKHHLFRPKIEEVARWLREESGIDIVVSPRFNIKTGNRIGYFWRWAQRTDVIDNKIYKTFEDALFAAISKVLETFKEQYT